MHYFSLLIRRLTLFSVLALVLGFPAASFALTLTPPTIEFSVNPGDTRASVVKLYNETSKPVTLYTEQTSFGAQGETGEPSYDFDSEPEDLASWVIVEPGPFTIEPNQRVEIPLSIAVPEDAEPGGHYATLFFSDVPPVASGGGEIAVGTKIGTLLLVTVSGDVAESGDIEEVFVGEHDNWLNRLPALINIRFSNTGNVHLRPEGTVSISNMFGKNVAELAVNEKNGATLPETIRKYDVTWEKTAVVENDSNPISDFFAEVRNEKQNFAFGKYTIDTQLTYGEDENETTNQITFWVWPWHLISVTLVGLILLIIIIVFIIKRYNAWLIKRTTVQ